MRKVSFDLEYLSLDRASVALAVTHALSALLLDKLAVVKVSNLFFDFPLSGLAYEIICRIPEYAIAPESQETLGVHVVFDGNSNRYSARLICRHTKHGLIKEHQMVLRLLFNEGGSYDRVSSLTGLTPKRVRELEKEAFDILHRTPTS